MSTKCKNAAVLPNRENLKKQTKYTARKTIFLKYTMRSSKIPRKNQLSINFSKNTVLPISEKFKTRTFQYSKNIVFHAEENIILHQLFESKKDRIFHLRKVQNKNFSEFRKHGIPCEQKYHLTSTF